MTNKEHDADDIQDKAETLFESEAKALDDFAVAPPAAVKSGVGWGAVLPLFLLAGLGGAVGGWALTQYVMPNYIALPAAQADQAQIQQTKTPALNLAPLTARLETVEKKLAAQSSELSFLSSEIKSGAASVTVGGVDKAFDVTPLLSRLEQMESRLDKAERPAFGDTSPVTDESGAVISASDYLDGLEDRLVTLEKSISEISDSNGLAAESISESLGEDLNAELGTLRLRVGELETQIAAASALAEAPTIVRETVLLPPFPREALLSAMTAPRDNETGGWVSQTLKKHISVRNPQDVARAQETLDDIQAHAASRDYAAALALIELMPSDVRSVAGEWTAAVKAEIETP